MQRQLGGKLDGLYYCPHLPYAGCGCRKPGLGLIRTAATELDIELSESWMVGDKLLDMETGFNAGLSTAMVRTGYGKDHLLQLTKQPSIVADDLLEAAKAIVKASNGSSNE
jgi:D-glycero-D-manno-heptose 1,7-bisphosphate phosphatase